MDHVTCEIFVCLFVSLSLAAFWNSRIFAGRIQV